MGTIKPNGFEMMRYDDKKSSGENKEAFSLQDKLEREKIVERDHEEALGIEKKNQLVTELGRLLHDEWREPRKREDGTFEPREKKTKDAAWMEKNGTDTVDIANTAYENLPNDWKGENKLSAEVALGEIYKAAENGSGLDDVFIEHASDVIHVKWLERNGDWASEEQKKPYNELSEEEKEKDRVIIRKGIEIYKASQEKTRAERQAEIEREKNNLFAEKSAQEASDDEKINQIRGRMAESKPLFTTGENMPRVDLPESMLYILPAEFGESQAAYFNKLIDVAKSEQKDVRGTFNKIDVDVAPQSTFEEVRQAYEDAYVRRSESNSR